MIAMTASTVPNCESNPSMSSIAKNRIAQTIDPGISKTASGYLTNEDERPHLSRTVKIKLAI